jgi:hypothetical protein
MLLIYFLGKKTIWELTLYDLVNLTDLKIKNIVWLKKQGQHFLKNIEMTTY